MGKIYGPPDDAQQDVSRRNCALAELLYGAWTNKNILSIERQPTPSNPPDLTGPRQGQWVAEVF